MIISRNGRDVARIPLEEGQALFVDYSILNRDMPGVGRMGDKITRAFAIVPSNNVPSEHHYPAGGVFVGGAIGEALMHLYFRREALSKYPQQRPIISLEDSIKVIKLYATAEALEGDRNVECNVNELFPDEVDHTYSLDKELNDLEYPDG